MRHSQYICKNSFLLIDYLINNLLVYWRPAIGLWSCFKVIANPTVTFVSKFKQNQSFDSVLSCMGTSTGQAKAQKI